METKLEFAIGLSHGVREALELFIREWAKNDPGEVIRVAHRIRGATFAPRATDEHLRTIVRVLAVIQANLTRTDGDDDLVDEHMRKLQVANRT